jgi:hypothetical protein
VILDIDYGALGSFNVPFQTAGDFSGGQLPPGINVRPAYTTVDSLNYQQHMFNTARTINAGGENTNYDLNNVQTSYNNYTDGQQFDVSKALFNQVDVNRDGNISREEFQQWAQAGQNNYQNTASSAQYNSSMHSNSHSYQQATIFDGANPAVANILQQSGLGQVVRPH